MSVITRLFFAGMFFCLSSVSASAYSLRSGLDLPPWPFPWARHCSVDWQSLQGRYTLVDSTARDVLELHLDNSGSKTHPVATVWRSLADGTITYVGVTYLAPDQSEIRVFLTSARGPGQPYWGYIRMHYTTESKECTQQLVPVFTLKRAPRDIHPVDYRMERQPDPKDGVRRGR